MGTLKIILVGPSLTKSKGGIASIITGMLQTNHDNIIMKHIPSHVEGNYLEKSIVAIKALIYIINHHDFDIIHIHVASKASFYRKSLFVFLACILHKHIVIHVHSGYFNSFFSNASGWLKKYIKYTFKSCDQVLVLSEYWYNFFNKNICKENLKILRNGVNAVEFNESCTPIISVSKFLFLGKLTKMKGIYDLLAAIKILIHEKRLTNLIFYIAGDGEMEQVQNTINLYDISSNVRLLGWIDNKEKLELFKQIDCVILPSYIEGVPMSLIEAMASGKIIISSNVGGIPDLVTDGVNGYLLEPGDVSSLCQLISFVSLSPSLMQAISNNNIKKIREEYNIPYLYRQMNTMYRDLIE